MQKWKRRAASQIALVIVCLSAALPALAIDPDVRISQFAHKAWRIRDGIFGSSANAIAQTADGYLWIGTEAGLMRFDGARFVPWRPTSGPPLDPRIFSLAATADGALWVGTGRGLSRVKDGKATEIDAAGRINSIVSDGDGVWVARARPRDDRGPICRATARSFQCRGTADGITLETAGQVVRAQDGALWFGGSAGLSRWTPSGVASFFQKEFSGEELFGLNAIAAAPDGSVWVSLEQEPPATLRRHHNGQWTTVALPQADVEVSHLFVDRNGAVWIGSMSHGLYRFYNGAFDHFGMADGLSSDGVVTFHQDHEDNLWVTTTQGLDLFRDGRVISWSVREGLSADSVSSIVAGPDGRVWAGNVGALDVLEKGKWSSIGAKEGLPGRVVTSLAVDHANRVWVGVDRRLWVYADGKFREIVRPDGEVVGRVLAMAEDRQRDMWVQGGEGFLRVRDLAVQEVLDFPEFSAAYVLIADPVEGMWMGLRGGELARVRRGQLERFPAPKGITLGSVMGLSVDPDGSVWAVVKQGIVRLVGKERKLLGTRNGLPCEGWYALKEDQQGALWLYGQCGVVSFSRAELLRWWANPETVVRPLVLDVIDGAQPGMATFQPSAARTPDGRLWFANDRIVQVVDPRALRKNPHRPRVHIEQIVADERSFAPAVNLVLPPLTRDIQIDYTALSFAVPQRVRFRYRLENRDEGWQNADTRRQAFYTDLQPGTYRFRVIACNDDGVWNERGATLDFRIAAAWYQTLWFRIASVLVLLLILLLVHRLRVRKIQRNLSARFDERLAERTRLARELHDTLLQTIQASKMVADTLSRSGDPVRLKRGVEQLSTWLAQAVKEVRTALNSLRNSTVQENDLAEAFRLAAESSLNPGMVVSIDVRGESQDLHPIVRDEIYHLGYEALRNAFTHSNASRVTVELRYEKDLTLRIADDGIGIAADVVEHGRPEHFGLQGMRERADRIQATLTFTPASDGGTVVTVVIPGNVVFAKGKRARR